ncbi:hypothetical protein BFF78_10690 [Streptomyces fodineus]|uniref:Uncharacterized protein n=1 Tax=Streptomyces fodineus TaxID=1904616 RepID=A0A1D7Y744_9ACTN|nr:hypothetical protein BFF78_10690 [Streptomyces fodineus]
MADLANLANPVKATPRAFSHSTPWLPDLSVTPGNPLVTFRTTRHDGPMPSPFSACRTPRGAPATGSRDPVRPGRMLPETPPPVSPPAPGGPDDR